MNIVVDFFTTFLSCPQPMNRINIFIYNNIGIFQECIIIVYVLEDTCILCIYFSKNKDHKLVFNSSISFLKLTKKS